MSLFFSLLPLYLLGNFHCLGMCGPLVMILGRHRLRHLYFLGRASSYTLAGLMAAEAGSLVHGIGSPLSFAIGGMMMAIGFSYLLKWGSIGSGLLAPLLAPFNKNLSLLILKDRPFPLFLFGFFTVALPCGQTLAVFSACALVQEPLIGAFNGLAFALLTMPGLLFSMQAHSFFRKFHRLEPYLMGGATLFAGVLTLLRGLAEQGAIDHFVLSNEWHLVLF